MRGDGVEVGSEWEARLDLQHSELLETIWKCEREWAQEDRIDAAVKYGSARRT